MNRSLLLFVASLIVCFASAQYVTLNVNFACNGVASLISANPTPLNYTTISGESSDYGSQATYNFVGSPTALTFLVACYETVYCKGPNPSQLLIGSEIILNLSYSNSLLTVSGSVKTYNDQLPFNVTQPTLVPCSVAYGSQCTSQTKNKQVSVSAVYNSKGNPSTIFNPAGTTPIAVSFSGQYEYYALANPPVYYGMNSLMTTLNADNTAVAYVPIPGLPYYFNLVTFSDNGPTQFTCQGTVQSAVTLSQYYQTFIATPSFYQWNVVVTTEVYSSGNAPTLQTTSGTTQTCHYGDKCTFKTPGSMVVGVNILAAP